MTFLTPLAALAALAALLPLAAWALGRRRTDAVRRSLELAAPRARVAVRALAGAGAVALLGLAAAQPVLTHEGRVRQRTGVEALFVFDISRSMAASATPTSPTRLDRAVVAAKRLRAAIADVPSGVATLTDRVLPGLLPVADAAAFDLVADRGVAIESPPPAETRLRATTFDALRDIPAGNYFSPQTKRRIVVLLTDGESDPVDAADLLPRDRGYRFVAVRLWRGDESVFRPDGERETAYRPDPLGRVVLDRVAEALDGHAYDEGELDGAVRAVRAAANAGSVTTTAAATPGRTPLAPYLAGLALLLLVIALLPLLDSKSS
jgi:hypothetical protein